jgi:Serine dehydrogenase proteinase
MPDVDPAKAGKLAREISARDKCDIFIYNGEIARSVDLDFVISVNTHRKHDACRLILVTNGGDPDAAFKISRYLQDKYRHFEILIPGLCKSAGTLIAIGAHGLIFTPYGELGPLDVQIFKEDKISAMHSGLNISEAMSAMEKAAIATYLKLMSSMFRSSGGVVSFATAAKAASDMVAGMYGPVFGQFDPEDVGGRTRSMRIAADYGKRLDSYAHNTKPDAIRKLAETYSSHSFVIDRMEASALFKSVREADPLELELVGALGNCARWQVASGKNEHVIDCLSHQEEAEKPNEKPPAKPRKRANGADRAPVAGAGGAPIPDPSGPGGRAG